MHLQEQPADLVIVSASAIESARLLLNSKSAMFPSGLGNQYDWVGRNLQGHAYTGAMGLLDFDIFDDLGPGASIAISDYNHGNPGLVRWRGALQRIHSPADSLHQHASAGRAALGRRAQRIHARFL